MARCIRKVVCGCLHGFMERRNQGYYGKRRDREAPVSEKFSVWFAGTVWGF